MRRNKNMKNIKYQFLLAINNNFRESMDKNSDKANGIRNTNKIYSYASRKNLVKVSSAFGDFMKENYPEIRYVKDIRPEHIQSFLVHKNSIIFFAFFIKKVSQK